MPRSTILDSNQKCAFCQIINNKIPSYKIYEDGDYLAILDISQFTEGHTIAIPKNHVSFVWDSPTIGKYFEFVQKIANHMRSLGYKYVDSLILGRKIPHAHVHLIPHNNKSGDYKASIKMIGSLQEDISRRIEPAAGKLLEERFRLY